MPWVNALGQCTGSIEQIAGAPALERFHLRLPSPNDACAVAAGREHVAEAPRASNGMEHLEIGKQRGNAPGARLGCDLRQNMHADLERLDAADVGNGNAHAAERYA